jgi:small conductance mechanosensitive channel
VQTDLWRAIKQQIDAQQISVPAGPQEITLVRGKPAVAPKAD